MGWGGYFPKNKTIVVTLIILFFASLFLFLLPIAEDSAKFYFLQFRLFEFLAGGICGIVIREIKPVKPIIHYSLVVLLCIVLFSSIIYLNVHEIGSDVRKLGGDYIREERVLLLPKQIMLIITVAITSIILLVGRPVMSFRNSFLSYFGKRSYSFFIWHQMIIAFYRYYISTSITVTFLTAFTIVLLLLAEASYQVIEKKISSYKNTLFLTFSVSFLVTVAGGLVYLRAGVVRDVPELNIFKNNVQRGMHAAYVDRVYQYSGDFPHDNGKWNVLVEGVSYGRDMANVLLESSYADSINLSYVYQWDKSHIQRIKEADFIFTFKGRDEVPDYVWDNMRKDCEIWGVGTKNYGQSNGSIYAKRGTKNYFYQVAPIHPWYKNKNEEWEECWGNNYFDFIKIAMTDNDHIRIFTDDNKFISQDCYHLTQAGAKWYAGQIDFSTVFK